MFLLAGAGTGLLSACASTPLRPVTPQSMPFTLGVASGEPGTNSLLIWTRVLPAEFDPVALHPAPVRVRWEVADDEAFSRIVRSGQAMALPERAHTLHIEVEQLAADRWYHFRFHAGAFTSPVGRGRTLPAAGELRTLRFGLASCQHYESGYFAAHRHLAAEAADLVWFVGDYIYEYGPAPADQQRVRRHDAPHCRSLSDYRRRYALYKRDADLQAMHASAPVLPIWDDHEVDNDYAGTRSLDGDPRFAARRAAAYRAYVEHMPLRWSRLGGKGSVDLYRTVDFGGLVRFHALDDRQYRDIQACSDMGLGAGYQATDACAIRPSPERTMLGARQERWLRDSLASARCRWNVVTQQTLMAPAAMGGRVWVDGWDGYPAARQRLINDLHETGAANPVVIGGDVHATYVADLFLDPYRPDSGRVAHEFCGTSITSRSWPQAAADRLVRENPWFRYARSDRRGYLRFDVRPNQLTVTLRAIDDANKSDATIESLAQFEVEAKA